jgi:hypothetical protein
MERLADFRPSIDRMAPRAIINVVYLATRSARAVRQRLLILRIAPWPVNHTQIATYVIESLDLLVPAIALFPSEWRQILVTGRPQLLKSLVPGSCRCRDP